MARTYCNIKDFEDKDFNVLKQIGFSTIQGGILAYNKQKISLEQLENIRKNIHMLSSWVSIKNSMERNMDNKRKYQAYVWIKLIKRTDKVALKDLIGVFTALINIQNNKEYRQKYSDLFCKRIVSVQGLSEDWSDRLMRTVNGL